MSQTDKITSLNSVRMAKKLGLPNIYGTARFGWSEFGDFNYASGLYRFCNHNGHRKQQQYDFWDYQPRFYPTQEPNRTKFANAILAWQALSIDDKTEYNRLAVGTHKSGYNLFIKRFMKL